MKTETNAAILYADIIDRQYQPSVVHRHISMKGRAAQFAPFAALHGHSESIDEAARHTDTDTAQPFPLERYATSSPKASTCNTDIKHKKHFYIRIHKHKYDAKHIHYSLISTDIHSIDRMRRRLQRAAGHPRQRIYATQRSGGST